MMEIIESCLYVFAGLFLVLYLFYEFLQAVGG